jgi:hypothetical protein
MTSRLEPSRRCLTTACTRPATRYLSCKSNRAGGRVMPSVMPPECGVLRTREVSSRRFGAVITTDCRPTRRQDGSHDEACAGGSRLNRGVRTA